MFKVGGDHHPRVGRQLLNIAWQAVAMDLQVVFATPLGRSAALAAVTALVCWLGQVLTGFCEAWHSALLRASRSFTASLYSSADSYVDMAWSVSPVIYAALFVPEAFEQSNARTILQFGEANIWTDAQCVPATSSISCRSSNCRMGGSPLLEFREKGRCM